MIIPRLRNLFFTGLAILLPIVLTFIIVNFLVNILTRPFEGITIEILRYYGLLGKSVWFFDSQEVLSVVSKVFILIFLFVTILILGLFAEGAILRSLLRVGHSLLKRIPLINKIYQTIQDVVHTLLGESTVKFSQVVLVPFPHDKALNIGLITRGELPTDSEHKDLISVFVPGTPNPTMGFMLLFRKNELIYIDMSVEEALKFVISCGVAFKGVNSWHTEQSPKN